MAPFCPEVLDLRRAMHQNLRLIREGASKDPSGLFDDAIRNSAQVVLLLANHLCFALEDRIQLLYEAGDYHEAQRVLDQQMSESAWFQRWLYGRRHSQMIKAIRRAVAREPNRAGT